LTTGFAGANFEILIHPRDRSELCSRASAVSFAGFLARCCSRRAVISDKMVDGKNISHSFDANGIRYTMAFKYAWWEYFLIPWMAGAVGYITNVLALQMTFYPIEFWGIEIFRIKGEPWGFFGWQGIIPTKAEKMASICFELMTKKLFNGGFRLAHDGQYH
jgi:hypothetical protein